MKPAPLSPNTPGNAFPPLAFSTNSGAVKLRHLSTGVPPLAPKPKDMQQACAVAQNNPNLTGNNVRK